MIFDDLLVDELLISVILTPYTILTGLSVSGKSKIAICLAKWMTSMSSRYLILNKDINDEDFKRKYTIIRKTSATLELINKDGLSGKIIPLPIDLIFEW